MNFNAQVHVSNDIQQRVGLRVANCSPVFAGNRTSQGVHGDDILSCTAHMEPLSSDETISSRLCFKTWTMGIASSGTNSRDVNRTSGIKPGRAAVKLTSTSVTMLKRVVSVELTSTISRIRPPCKLRWCVVRLLLVVGRHPPHHAISPAAWVGAVRNLFG